MVNTPPRQPRSAGIILAISPVAGAVIGGLMGQPSIGLLAGIAVGGAIAVAFWLLDKQR